MFISYDTTDSKIIKAENVGIIHRYKCLYCKENLDFVKGGKISSHFRHQSNSKSNCIKHPERNKSENGYKLNIRELDDGIHDLVVKQLSNLLKVSPIKIVYECPDGHNYDETMDYTKEKICVERTTKYNGGTIRPDISILNKEDEIICMFEIFNTHKTSSDSRFGKWFEISVVDFSGSPTIWGIPKHSINKCPMCLHFEKYRKAVAEYQSSDESEYGFDKCPGIKGLRCSQDKNIDDSLCSNCSLYNKQSQKLREIPYLFRKTGVENKWEQEQSCVECGRYSYSPVFYFGYRSICKLCVIKL